MRGGNLWIFSMPGAAMRAVLAHPLALAAAVSSTVTVAALADAAVATLREPGTADLAATLTTFALGAAAAAVLAPVLALAAFLSVRALALVPRLALPLVLLFVTLAVVGAASVIEFDRIQWDAVDLWLPTSLLGSAFGLAATFAWLMRRGRTLLLAHCSTQPLLGLVAMAAFLAANPAARSHALAVVDQGSVLLSPLVQRASRMLDRDGDGHPRWLCGQGCDCDDRRADVHPLARELPANGIDEDCDGRDQSKSELAGLLAAFSGGQAERPGAEQRVGPSQQPKLSGAKTAVRTRPPDVLLIVVDTLRLDHLGLYGYARATSPRIDALGKESMVFEQARSAGPSTRFSMPAMLTSKWFTEIARNRDEWPTIAQSEVLLGERLHDLGYTLAAFHSIRYFRPYFHLGQGFDHWSDRVMDERKPELAMTSSDYITDEVLTWVDDRARDRQATATPPPRFLWAYYGDPHAEYMRHKGYPSFGNTSIDRYDGEIVFTDHHVGRLLDGLAARKYSDDLIIILTSDHGEALDKADDHGALNHSKDLYDELVHVPLMIKGPGFAPGRVTTPVSLIDILPTLLELANAPLAPELRGVSLMPWLQHAGQGGGAEPTHPPLFLEKHRAIDDPQKGMLAWPYKVIMTVPTGRVEIYDLERDPRERTDVYETLAAEERARLTGMIGHWTSQVLRPAPNNYRH
jgi:arylsulfatase A-like enzyme